MTIGSLIILEAESMPSPRIDYAPPREKRRKCGPEILNLQSITEPVKPVKLGFSYLTYLKEKRGSSTLIPSFGV